MKNDPLRFSHKRTDSTETMKFLTLILKNIGRNRLRTILTSLGTMILVFVVTLVWSILAFLDNATAEQSKNFKVIITERWQIPSRMPVAYARNLEDGAASKPDDIRPLDSMTWQFYGGTLDPVNMTRENNLFAIAMDPAKILTMMDELDNLSPEQAAPLAKAVSALQTNRQGMIVGQDRLKSIKKGIGDRFKLTSLNYKGIDLEFEVVGTFPDGRYNNSAIMHRDYLTNAMEAWPRSHNGEQHPMMMKSLFLVWLKVPDRQQLSRLSQQIESSPLFSNPTVKVETASSGVANFLEAYRDLLWGMRWLLAPAVLITLSLVISNSISISVRERRMEFAVLKVLGFKPRQILLLVLGEALIVGTFAGGLSSMATYLFINSPPPWGMGGLKFPIAFFAAFLIPVDALWWGPGVGIITAFLGSLIPAWSARKVKVSDVFAKVA